MFAPYVRTLWALLVTAFMMLMAGASPARAAAFDDGTAPQPFAGFDVVAAGGRFSELSDAVAANARAVDRTGSVEVVLTLQGNSLAAEQSARRASALPVLDATAQKAYVASIARAHAAVQASVRALGGRVLHDYRIVYNGIAVVVDRSLLTRVAMLPGDRLDQSLDLPSRAHRFSSRRSTIVSPSSLAGSPTRNSGATARASRLA